jgi:hypothetical protein
MPATDILLSILTKMKALHPTSSFVDSLHSHYCNRGGLSKKQLEGLLDKMMKTTDIPQANIATVQAIILKKHVREKAKPTITATPVQRDFVHGKLMEEILLKYPQHKRILFLKSKYDKNEAMSTQDFTEIEKLHKLLVK